MLTLALLLVQAALPSSKPPRDVVVTGRPLASTEQAWRDCIARGCPPDQEIAAALAHAENQFVDGDYAAADRTLDRTIDRLADRAGEHPVPVGDLWRARSRIKEHRGELELARHAAGKSLFALRKGLGRDDPRALMQQLELGDMLAKTGHLEAALDVYDGVADRARASGDVNVQGFAMLSATVLATAYAQVDPAGTPRARRRIAGLLSVSSADFAPVRDAAALFSAVLDAKEGDRSAVDRAIERLSARTEDRPVLLYSPPLGGDPRAEAATVRSSDGARGARSFSDHWVDLGFWVSPDGGVRDVQLLRSGGRTRPSWVQAMIAQVRGRRYAPLKAGAGAPGAFRVERVTWTQSRTTFTGSRIQMASGLPRVVTTDLTVDKP